MPTECITHSYFFNSCVKLYDIIHFLLFLFRLHNHNPPTYETGSTRKFLLGRTDTIRSASIASSEFVKAMVSPNKTVSIKVCFGSKCPIDARAYSSFCGMKWVVIFPWTSLGQDARPWQRSVLLHVPPASPQHQTCWNSLIYELGWRVGETWIAWSLRS